jgi:Derlin-2/3
MVVYVWSRRNPHAIMSLFGLFQFSAPYLPWVLLVMGMLLDQSPVFDILGILVGHIYFFFEDVYPRFRPNRRVLKTPAFM